MRSRGMPQPSLSAQTWSPSSPRFASKKCANRKGKQTYRTCWTQTRVSGIRGCGRYSPRVFPRSGQAISAQTNTVRARRVVSSAYPRTRLGQAKGPQESSVRVCGAIPLMFLFFCLSHVNNDRWRILVREGIANRDAWST